MPDERQQAVRELVYEFGENLEEVVHLSGYAVSARYPGEMSDVNRQEAETATDLANRIFDWVERQIKIT